jgi:hypothetical protein
MLSFIRPVFEVVKEGRILNNIKHIHLSILAVIKPSLQSGSFAKSRHRRDSLRSARCQDLDKNGCFDRKMSWKYSSPTRASSDEE